MQDGVHLLRHPKFRFATSLPSISTAQHTVKLPPKGSWSFTTATRTGKVPLKVPSSPVWVARFSGCFQGACLVALQGEHSLKVAHSVRAMCVQCTRSARIPPNIQYPSRRPGLKILRPAHALAEP